ncbi:transporter substrate-binding domain-containing protein [Neisseriaceae bacterium TC5R-5]|nr:transporter substrate-binding domain-containing protein [Neisseriaceae bacterium TC5R-5]
MYRLMICCLLLLSSLSWAQAELVMGYRTNERLPYIDDQNNEGIYKALYSAACQRLGVNLKIVRLPKKRVVMALALGEIDFYPGYAFNTEREPTVLFVSNGLDERSTIVSRMSRPAIKSYADLAQLTEIRNMGNPSRVPPPWDKAVKTIEIAELGSEQALKMLALGKADFYLYDETTLHYYWSQLHPTELRLNSSLEKWQPMDMGFSKQSKLYKSVKNPSYRADLPLSPQNYPVMLDPASIPGKLAKTLQAMRHSGEIDKIIERHTADASKK